MGRVRTVRAVPMNRAFSLSGLIQCGKAPRRPRASTSHPVGACLRASTWAALGRGKSRRMVSLAGSAMAGLLWSVVDHVARRVEQMNGGKIQRQIASGAHLELRV